MIPGPNLWQSHSGAAHQVEDDTPSLERLCFRAAVVPVETMLKTEHLVRSTVADGTSVGSICNP